MTKQILIRSSCAIGALSAVLLTSCLTAGSGISSVSAFEETELFDEYVSEYGRPEIEQNTTSTISLSWEFNGNRKGIFLIFNDSERKWDVRLVSGVDVYVEPGAFVPLIARGISTYCSPPRGVS